MQAVNKMTFMVDTIGTQDSRLVCYISIVLDVKSINLLKWNFLHFRQTKYIVCDNPPFLNCSVSARHHHAAVGRTTKCKVAAERVRTVERDLEEEAKNSEVAGEFNVWRAVATPRERSVGVLL